MAEKKNVRFTSGQFASLHQVNRRTLHYYDQIGLFSPEETGENHYRYYTLSQCMDFSIIRSLRELNMSIEDIKKMTGDTQRSLALLSQKEMEIQEKILHLSDIQEMLKEKYEMLKTICETPISHIEVQKKPIQYLKFSPSIDQMTPEQETETLLDFSRLFTRNSLFNHIYGTALLENQYYFFAKLRKSDDLKPDLILPEQRYLVGYCLGPWDNLKKSYENMFSYADSHGLKLDTISFEQGMNEAVIETMDEYVTQILIPIKK